MYIMVFNVIMLVHNSIIIPSLGTGGPYPQQR